ncbi:MAG TPA: DUF763 domain-containing protein [Pyrodictium sp.]|nr:DUF763 domain-containing protein [Pyrodictium sp.]
MDVTGVAELPLHSGKVPPWMANYMKKLARAIVEVIVEEYGPREIVRRLADPIWFQAFNNAIGMDWDSSGSTTVTLGILRQVADENPHLGIVVVGGKGRLAVRVPEELPRRAERLCVSSSKVEEALLASRLAAKTDNVLLQDGYQLYHHTLIMSEDGLWAIVQQGMNVEVKLARRYHWLGPRTSTVEPHSGIASVRREQAVLDLTSKRSIGARNVILDLVRQEPRKTVKEVFEAYRLLKGIIPITSWLTGEKSDHAKRDVIVKVYKPQARPPRHLEPILRKLYEISPRNIEELLLVEGVGPAVLRSLALVSELIYGAEVSHKDPVTSPLDPFRYAYIVGGKDGVPFKFDPKLAEQVVKFLEDVIERARIGDRERLHVLRRLRRLLAPPKT